MNVTGKITVGVLTMQCEKLMRKLTRMSRVKGKMLENEEWEDVEEKE